MLNHSAACERNQAPILSALQQRFQVDAVQTVLEVGSGTGQHAVYFGQHMPFLTWQTADQAHYIEDIQQRLAMHDVPNVLPPVVLDVMLNPWPVQQVDAVFSANTLHIMSESHVVEFFRGCGQVIVENGLLVVYGPFNYDGAFTSDSNAQFDMRLRDRDASMGIRDIEWVQKLAQQQGFFLQEDLEMPANNRLLCWQKKVV